MQSFERTNEQTMYQDSLSKLLSQTYDFQTRAKRIAKGELFDQKVWSQLAELGMLSILIPEKHGGLGGNMSNFTAIMEIIGQSLVLEPVMHTSLGAWLIAHYANDTQKNKVLPNIMQGNICIIPTLYQQTASSPLMELKDPLTLKKDSTGLRLNGRISMVPHGQNATHLVVKAQSERDHEVHYLMVKAELANIQSYSNIDDTNVADLTFDNVVIESTDLFPNSNHLLENLLYPRIISALSAESVGICTTLNTKTRQYTKQREQFGRPISKFQALQHRMVEMFLQEEQARSLSLALALALDTPNKLTHNDHLSYALATKMQINRYLKHIGEESVQLHGGMGVSDELDIAHYFRRLTVIRHSYGQSNQIFARIVEELTKHTHK